MIYIPGEKTVKIKNIYAEYYKLAEEYFKLENFSKAVEFYKYSMGDKSLHDASYYQVGRCYAFLKQYDESLEIFKNILKKDPENTAIKSSLAYLYAMKGDYKKSLNMYKNMVLDNPDNSEILINYISILIYAKDYETAKINLDFLETKFPDTKELPDLKKAYEEAESGEESDKIKPASKKEKVAEDNSSKKENIPASEAEKEPK
ncbi:MAG: tetratricopeptide repeat protein [Treponema sp.]|nr:tetratricopeptide repeat protein [Candidatus Treponema merdequi]